MHLIMIQCYGYSSTMWVGASMQYMVFTGLLLFLFSFLSLILQKDNMFQKLVSDMPCYSTCLFAVMSYGLYFALHSHLYSPQ